MTRPCFKNTEAQRPQSLNTSALLCVLRASVFQIYPSDDLQTALISGQLNVEELDIETGEPLVEAEA